MRRFQIFERDKILTKPNLLNNKKANKIIELSLILTMGLQKILLFPASGSKTQLTDAVPKYLPAGKTCDFNMALLRK